MAFFTVFEYEPSALLQVSDEDAADFLQSHFSKELRPFEAGGCTYGLFLDVKGKILADAFVLCRGAEEFLIVSPNSGAAVIEDTLGQHIIADDVEVERLDASAAACLIGAGAEAALESLGLEAPGPGRFSEAGGVVAFRGRRVAANQGPTRSCPAMMCISACQPAM